MTKGSPSRKNKKSNKTPKNPYPYEPVFSHMPLTSYYNGNDDNDYLQLPNPLRQDEHIDLNEPIEDFPNKIGKHRWRPATSLAVFQNSANRVRYPESNLEITDRAEYNRQKNEYKLQLEREHNDWLNYLSPETRERIIQEDMAKKNKGGKKTRRRRA